MEDEPQDEKNYRDHEQRVDHAACSCSASARASSLETRALSNRIESRIMRSRVRGCHRLSRIAKRRVNRMVQRVNHRS